MCNEREEYWRDASIDLDYEVSNLGRIRSKERTYSLRCRWGFKRNVTYRSRYLAQCSAGAGYLTVGIKNKKHYVHRLVADAFCEGKSEDTEVNHIDGDKTNNWASNLEWCTHRENLRHSVDVLGNHRRPVKCL